MVGKQVINAVQESPVPALPGVSLPPHPTPPAWKASRDYGTEECLGQPAPPGEVVGKAGPTHLDPRDSGTSRGGSAQLPAHRLSDAPTCVAAAGAHWGLLPRGCLWRAGSPGSWALPQPPVLPVCSPLGLGQEFFGEGGARGGPRLLVP